VHAIITPVISRETLYVAMTRGRHANHAYICTDTPNTEPHQHHTPPTAQRLLAGVLARTGAQPSAHQTIVSEQTRYGGTAQLAAEYDTIAAVAQRPRWTRLIRGSGLTEQQASQVVASDAFGPLTAALRRADAHGLTPERVLPQLIDVRSLDGAGDLAAVLQHRLDACVARQARQRVSQREARLIVGLIPHADGPMAADMRTALNERQKLIEQRATELARTAVAERQPWTRHLGPAPTDPHHRRAWSRDVRTIAAYRDRHAITSDTPLGQPATTATTSDDAHLAAAALRRVQHVAQQATPTHGLRQAPAARSHERHGPGM
jgi:hypothetical protein